MYCGELAGPMALIATWVPPPVCVTFGSGKFATPCSRMQAEYLYALVAISPGPCRWAPEVVVVGEAPPHPAASSATPPSAAVNGIIRRTECMICDLLETA